MTTITVKCQGCGKDMTFDADWFRKNSSPTSIYHCSDACLIKVLGLDRKGADD